MAQFFDGNAKQEEEDQPRVKAAQLYESRVYEATQTIKILLEDSIGVVYWFWFWAVQE